MYDIPLPEQLGCQNLRSSCLQKTQLKGIEIYALEAGKIQYSFIVHER